MRDARTILDEQFVAMRALCLRLAADFDRIQAGEGGGEVSASDPRVNALRQALAIAGDPNPQRAARLTSLLSEK